jgi:4-amino-4-deoxy-L-arabinose transferase-like glycosyltransferase
MTGKKYMLLLFFAVIAYALLLNEMNVHAIRKKNPENIFCSGRSMVYNKTIASIDNEWYIRQVKNFLNRKGFTIDPARPHYDVRRTPVYPIFYGIHYFIFGEEGSFFYIRYTQIFLYALATIALFFAALNFTGNKTIAGISAVLFGFNPTLVSFLYYTITEGLSPALICFLLYFLSLCVKYNRKKDWLLTGIFFALASLCRPAIFITAPAIFFTAVYLNLKNHKAMLVNGSLFISGVALLFLPYIIRNYIVTKGEFILLEKYYGDPMDYGLPNIELRGWISCWMNPADYSSEEISNHMKIVICCDSTTKKEDVLKKEMKRVPARGFMINNKKEISETFSSLYDYYDAKTFHKPTLDSLQASCSKRIWKMRNEFTEKAPFQYYVVTPMLIVKSVLLQSNSASIAILDNYKDNYIKIFWKMLLYALNIYIFLSLPFAIFIKRYTLFATLTLIFTVCTFGYIVFHIRYFEARYLIPLFPFLYITGAACFYEGVLEIRKRLHF